MGHLKAGSWFRWLCLPILLVLVLPCVAARVTTATSPQEEVTNTSLQQELTGTSPQEEVTTTSPQQELTGTSPQEEVTTTSPQQEVTGTSPQEEVTNTSPQQELTGTSPQEEVTNTSPQQELTGTSPQEEVTTTSPQQEVTGTSPQEEVTNTSPQQEVTGTSPQEEVTNTSSQHEVTGTSPQEEVTNTSLQQELTGSSPQEEVTNTSPQQEVTVTFPQQEVTGTFPQEVTGTSPQEASSTSPQEEVTNTSPQEASITSPQEASSTSPQEEVTNTSPQEASITSPHEASSTSPQEEVTNTAPEEASSTPPREEVTNTSPQQEAPSTSPQEEVTNTSPQQEAPRTSPQEEVTNTAPEEASSTPPREEVTNTSPQQEVPSTSPQEEVTNTSPKEEAPSMSPQEAPYGTWRSPVSSEMVTQATNRIVEPPRVDPVTGYVFWSEQLGSDNGISAVFHFNPATGERVRWTTLVYDVWTKVHEYGGGSFTVYNNTLFFSNADDKAIYRQDDPTTTPTRLTTSPGMRYADGVYSPQMDALVYVAEDHGVVARGEAKEPLNSLVLVDANTGHQTVLVQGADFYAAPRLSPDGRLLAWVQWNHPQMPWWETMLCVGEMTANNSVDMNHCRVAGSTMMPLFDLNNDLFYVSDQTGWWNLYKLSNLTVEDNVTPVEKEVGWPMWKFGYQPYDINPKNGSNEAVVIIGHEVVTVDLASKKRTPLHTGYSAHTLGVAYSTDGTQVFVVAGDGARVPRLIQVKLATGEVQVANTAGEPPVSSGYISLPSPVRFPTSLGDSAYGFLYLPKNKDYQAPPGTRPPLLVRAHGGPTDATNIVLDLNYQFFTSRGFAILDVDYRGSTGYGREYRNKLNGWWGIMDVDDVKAGADHLVKENLVDPGHMCIDGMSAGGFTTLATLTKPGSPFAAGASYYGISDLVLLATHTHKFEARYMDTLIGRFDTQKDLYVSRSPITNYQRLDTPMIFFQGSVDKIVPPDQARNMYEVVKTKGLPTAFILYQGEDHGFVRAENKRSSLEAELFFFSEVLNFTLGDVTSNVVIENLDTWRHNQQLLA